MNPEDIKSYLSNIEELLLDEQKIVTYRWLAKTFGIHCNISKQLLYTFFENSPKKEELSVTYLLIGLSKEENSHQVFIVKDKDVEEAEIKLKSITSKHIYSIQKCKDLSDINVLYDPPGDESINDIPKGVSAIDFNNKQRDNGSIAKLRLNALQVAPSQPALEPKKTNSQPVSKTKSPAKIANEESNNVEKSKPNSTSDNKKPVIPSIFNNNTGLKKKAAAKPAAGDTKKNTKKPQGIGAFFSKAVNKPVPTNEPKEVPESNETKKDVTDSKVNERLSPLKENKATLNICTEAEDKIKKEESPKENAAKKVENKPKAMSKKATNKSGKKKAVKKVNSDQKKRKRLVVLSDSDSNGGSEDEEEVTREPTPEPQPTFIPDEDIDDVILGTPEPSKKRKKRQLVSKTYTSPDGFMVTKKHYEEVSASEEEEDGPAKKIKTSSPQDNSSEKQCPSFKSPSPQKTKQSSLMSFFKKK